MLGEIGSSARFYPRNIGGEFDNLSRTVNDYLKTDVQYEESFWFMGNLKRLLSIVLYKVYDLKNHPVLGISPREIFQNAIKSQGDTHQGSIRYDNKFKMLTYPIVERKVSPKRGIKNNYFYYWTDEFIKSSINRKKIKVKYDPEDINIAFAYINGSWKKLVRYGTSHQSKKSKVRSVNIYD